MVNEIALAIDIGGSKFIAGMVNSSGEILCSERYLWTELSAEGVMRDIRNAVHSLLAAHSGCRPTIIGATIPGLADPKKGLCVE